MTAKPLLENPLGFESGSLSAILKKIRGELPILERQMGGRPLVYLDNAASFPKWRPVLKAVEDFSFKHYSNIHRSVHRLSQEATEMYEGVRTLLATDLGAAGPQEVIFTKGTTESINLVCSGLFESGVLSRGDQVLVSRAEHHANFVPWQNACARYGAEFKIIELENFRLSPEQLMASLSPRSKILAVSAVSNVLGAENPLHEIVRVARKAGLLVLVDAAQVVSHGPFNIASLGDPDFVAFSGHKMGSPNGVGVLWGKEELLKKLSPRLYGGDMILEVRDDVSTWNELPWKLEAGTPAIDAVIGLGSAWEFMKTLPWDRLQEHLESMTQKGLQALQNISGLRLLGPESAENRYPLFSFTVDALHPHDLGTFLDNQGIAVRAGHHCAQPLHRQFQSAASTRASFAFYNEEAELDRLVEALREAIDYFVRQKKWKS